MLNKKENTTEFLLNLVENLPLFTIESIPDIGIAESSLRVKLHRLVEAGKIIRIKRGVYVSAVYLDSICRGGTLNTYLEFVATKIYEPSYISTEYVLQKHGILSELTQAITVVTTNKKKRYTNIVGIFTYRQIRKELFMGFNMKKGGVFILSIATKAKALFDFLYLRKNIINNKNAFDNLRLNLFLLSVSDLREFSKYIKKEASGKMSLLELFVKEAWQKTKK